MDDKYYPCIMDWDTGQISKRVGPAMSFQEAVDFLKQNFSGSWSSANAAAVAVTKGEAK